MTATRRTTTTETAISGAVLVFELTGVAVFDLITH
jgi:hypothetical protein